jgi:tripartite ATP-independent transporter DctP family solute receptor
MSRFTITGVAIGTLLAGLIGSASAAPVQFTFATTNGPKDFSSQAAVRWQQALKERSKGELEMRFVGGGALGGDSQLLQQLGNNEIQVHVAGPVVIHTLLPEYQCLEAEFVYRDEQHGFRVWNGPLGKQVSKALEDKYGISIIGVASRGARHVTSRKPIAKPADLQGVKIRVTNPLRTEVFKAYGALPGPLPISELYGALRQGVYDAEENPISTIWGNKFFEVQDYINLTGHVWSYNIVSANKKFVDSLTAAQRKIFFETLNESMVWLNEQVKSEEDSLLDRMVKQGNIKVVKADVPAFQAIAAPIVEKFAAEKCRPGIMKDIAAAAK